MSTIWASVCCIMFQPPPTCHATRVFASIKHLGSLPSIVGALQLQHHSQQSSTELYTANAMHMQAGSGGQPDSSGHPVMGHQAKSGDRTAIGGHSTLGGHSASGGRPEPGCHPVSGGHSASGCHPVSGGNSASGGRPESGCHPVSGVEPRANPKGHPVAGPPPVQIGFKPAAAPAPSSAPGPAPLSRGPFGQLVAYGSIPVSMSPVKPVHLENGQSAAVTGKAPPAGNEVVAWSSQAQVPNTVAAGAAHWNKPAVVKGFRPAAATLTTQRMTVADGKVGQTVTTADSAPKAAAQNKAREPAFVPRDLNAAGPSASSLAQRAAQSQHTLQRPHSALASPTLAASSSLAATLSSTANVQQQRSEPLPSSPLPQQTSSQATAASLQACPGSGQPVKGNPDEHGLAVKGKPNEQPVPMKGNANGQASGSAAAPVQSTLKEQLTPAKGKANQLASGLVAADAAAAAAAAAADQRQVAGNDVASPGTLTVAAPSGQPAADAEAAAQEQGMGCGATSPTLTSAVPKSQRRHLLQQDSSKRRRQACMVHLKAARLDIIKWMRTQHAVGIFLVILSMITQYAVIMETAVGLSPT